MDRELAANSTLSHYRIERQRGAGGMGEVYLAHDLRLRRPVALKVLPSKYTADRERLQRFEQEACAASALNHPNILTVYEVGVEHDTHFIATEYIEGVTLRHMLREAKIGLVDALDVAYQTAVALAAAHAAGVVHRDIKPENIMLRHDHVVKVLDFGVAKLVEAENPSTIEAMPTRAYVNTEPGMVIGTAHYMSPEQARGSHTDARTDVWSLGVVLYEMFAGHIPFAGETMSHVTVSILDQEPPPLGRVAEIPAELQRIVRKCLTKARDERYQTARDLMIDLKNLRRELDVQGELERTAAPHRTGAPQTETGRNARMTVIHDAAPTLEGDARRLSTAEYCVRGVRRHKNGAISIAALAAVVVAASMVFLDVRSARALTERDTILLTDFVNTTGDSVFDGTLKQALAVQLEQSPFLTLFSDDRVRAALRFMGRSPDARVSRDIAREICQRQGLKAMLAGSIAGLGSQYVITLEATNAQTGDAIAQEQVEATSKEQVLRALGDAATNLRQRLGESLASIQKFDAPIEQATTSSLDAFKAFSLGFEQQLNGKYFEAIPFYGRAADIDPNFALAYARLASVYSNSGEYELAADASQKAYDLRDRVSERERLYISMSYYSNVTREVEKYIETLQVWERTYPRDVVPHNNLALQYNDIGRYEKARDEAHEAIRLNPNAAPPYSNLARAFSGLNRFDEAKQAIGRALAQKAESLFMHRILYSIAFVQGDQPAMKQQVEWVNGKPEEYTAQSWQSKAAAFSGQVRKAAEFSRRAAELAQHRALKEVLAQIVAEDAERDALFSDCKQVKAKSAKALAITKSQPARLSAANALAACGEFLAMQAITDELSTRYPKDTLLNEVFLPLVHARAELYRGNGARVIELLETTRPYVGAALFQVAYLRGQAYLSQHNGAEASTEFQTILDHRGAQPTSPLYPLARLGLARAAILNGDTTKARKAYQDFFALWKDADPDIPTLQQARREHENVK